jgi:nucleosome binding factor SPN SPT16 subunit
MCASVTSEADEMTGQQVPATKAPQQINQGVVRRNRRQQANQHTKEAKQRKLEHKHKNAIEVLYTSLQGSACTSEGEGWGEISRSHLWPRILGG